MVVEVTGVVADHGSVVVFATTEGPNVTIPAVVAQSLVYEIEEMGYAQVEIDEEF